jgi:hypothetical protein
MTYVLDLEGIALEQLVAFTALLFLLYSLEYSVTYAAAVFSSSSVDLSCSDSCTRGFFPPALLGAFRVVVRLLQSSFSFRF